MDMVVWTCKTNQNKVCLYGYNFLITMCVPDFHILVKFVYEYMWQYVSFVFLGTINFYDRNN